MVRYSKGPKGYWNSDIPYRLKRLMGRKARKAHKKKQREKEGLERRRREKIKVMDQRIARGDLFILKNQQKEAFYCYLRAKDIAVNYNKEKIALCDEKIKIVQWKVNLFLNNILQGTIKKIEELLLAERYFDIKPVERDFFNYLKKFNWINIDETYTGFQEIVLSHWEFAFPKLLMLADDYYDRRQYKQAIEMFNVCKELVKSFKFSSYRTHLIKAFKHYEMICLVQIIIAEMHEKIEHARILMGSNKTQEALSMLNEANSLEAKIPTLFRDKKRLKDLHYKMNQLREDSYK